MNSGGIPLDVGHGAHLGASSETIGRIGQYDFGYMSWGIVPNRDVRFFFFLSSFEGRSLAIKVTLLQENQKQSNHVITQLSVVETKYTLYST